MTLAASIPICASTEAPSANEPGAIEAVCDSKSFSAVFLFAFKGLNGHMRVEWPYSPHVLHRGLPLEFRSAVTYDVSEMT